MPYTRKYGSRVRLEFSIEQDIKSRLSQLVQFGKVDSMAEFINDSIREKLAKDHQSEDERLNMIEDHVNSFSDMLEKAKKDRDAILRDRQQREFDANHVKELKEAQERALKEANESRLRSDLGSYFEAWPTLEARHKALFGNEAYESIFAARSKDFDWRNSKQERARLYEACQKEFELMNGGI